MTTPPAIELIRVAADALLVTSEELRSPSRRRELTYKRHIAMFAIRYGTELSYPAIGRLFQRDHTTVIHGVERVHEILEDDGGYSEVPYVESVVRAIRQVWSGESSRDGNSDS